jgi:hypothetical protein
LGGREEFCANSFRNGSHENAGIEAPASLAMNDVRE